MQHLRQSQFDAYHLVNQIEDLAAGCDPDFDVAYEDLEREFAELRLTFNE